LTTADNENLDNGRLRRMNEQAMEELAELRRSIDNIDAALIHLLAERFKNTKNVGKLKARAGMPPSDPEREKRQIDRLRALAVDADLDPAFAEKFLEFILAEVIQHHKNLAADSA
jgi:chorismate mutase